MTFIGLILAVFAGARLLQTPIEHSSLHAKQALLWVIALAACAAIVLIVIMMLLVGTIPISALR